MNTRKYPAHIIRGEEGATLVFLAIILLVLLGVAALSMDLGMLYIGRQMAQNACDVAAISGGALLTGQPSCATQSAPPALAAQQIASANNQLSPTWQVLVPDSSNPGVEVTFPSGSVTSDSGASVAVNLGQAIRVRGYIKVNYGFARIIGFAQTPVYATSTVVIQPVNGLTSALFVPLVVSNTTVFGANGVGGLEFGQQATLKTTSWQDNFIGSGNFGAIVVPGDGPGASDFSSRLAGDSQATTISASPPTTVDTKTGNMQGPTYQGLSDRLAKETDSRFTNDSTAWSNWLGAYNSTTGTFPSTWRIMLVPIVQDPPAPQNGKSQVTIIGYAGFFIESAPKNQPVVGRFIQGVLAGGTVRWLFPNSGVITQPDTITAPHLIS